MSGGGYIGAYGDNLDVVLNSTIYIGGTDIGTWDYGDPIDLGSGYSNIYSPTAYDGVYSVAVKNDNTDKLVEGGIAVLTGLGLAIAPEATIPLAIIGGLISGGGAVIILHNL